MSFKQPIQAYQSSTSSLNLCWASKQKLKDKVGWSSACIRSTTANHSPPKRKGAPAFTSAGLVLLLYCAAAGVAVNGCTETLTQLVSHLTSDRIFSSAVKLRSGTAVQVQNLLTWQSLMTSWQQTRPSAVQGHCRRPQPRMWSSALRLHIYGMLL